ncbi:hypothetical protein SUGI_0478110 [Cryptomeria japonica]|nr:hypothetical protein SUGI_0478110 [Cryptomeria japonica]
MDENISNDAIKQLQQQMLRDLFGQGNIVSNSYVEDLEYIPYEVDVLSFPHSKNLFFEEALGRAKSSLPPGIETIDVEYIVNMCGGIPLLVELAGRDIERVVDEIYRSLDELSKGCLHKFEKKEVSEVFGKVQLEVLLDAALVKLSFDDEKLWSMMWGTEEETPQFILDSRKVQVHDIIKERGRWLSQPDRILELESLNYVLQDRKKMEKIKEIGIPGSANNDEFEIEAESLNIPNSSLRVLILPKSIKVNGICWHSFESLKYLNVDGNSLIHPRQFKRLALLVADSEHVNELAASLQLLSLENSANLPALLQRFDNLSSLECSDLRGCNALVSIPTSFGKLESLTLLDLNRCGNLTTLPENIENLSTLQALELSECTKLASFPSTFGQLKSLLYLDLEKCSEFALLPDNLGNLSTLQQLQLKGCEKLVELPESFGDLSALKLLDLSKCSNLEGLQKSFGQLKSLILEISNCHKLKTLNGSF